MRRENGGAPGAPRDEAGPGGTSRFADRVLTGMLLRAYPPALVDRVLDQTGTQERRRRLMPARLTVYLVLALWALGDDDAGHARVLERLLDGTGRPGSALFDRGAAAGHTGAAPTVTAITRARARIGAAPLRMLFESLSGSVGGSGTLCCGLRVVSIDAASLDVPDTDANARAFGRADAAPGAYPRVRWAAAAESRTGALLGAAFGSPSTSDDALLTELLPALGPGRLVVADGALLSPGSLARLRATGAHLLWRARANAELPEPTGLAELPGLPELPGLTGLPGPTGPAELPDGSRLVTVRADGSPGADGAARPGTVRLVPLPGSGVLVTDLLDPVSHPAGALVEAWSQRWRCRAVVDPPAPGARSATLRSRDPDGVLQELWAMVAVYQAVHVVVGTGDDGTAVAPARLTSAPTGPGARAAAGPPRSADDGAAAPGAAGRPAGAGASGRPARTPSGAGASAASDRAR